MEPTPLPAPLDSSPSLSSSTQQWHPWWQQPERILAVLGAIGLRAFGKLGEDMTTTVLLSAMGGQLLTALLAKRRAAGK